MRKIFLIGLVMCLSACSSYMPLYDPESSKDGGKNYYTDLHDCEHIVKKHSSFWSADTEPKQIDQCLTHRGISVMSGN